MKTELTGRFEDIEIKMVLYPGRDNPQQEFDEYLEDDKKVHQEMGIKKQRFFEKIRRFEPKEDKPEALLQSYGPCKIVVEYLCDNYVSWEGGQIISAYARDGAQAQRFLEYCLNKFGDIPFVIQESKKGRRTLNLQTGARHPLLMWGEMYNIFVDELNGRNISITDRPRRLYQRLLGRVYKGLVT